MNVGRPGICACGARGVQVVLVDGVLGTPGHVCRRSVSGAATLPRTTPSDSEPVPTSPRRSARAAPRGAPNGWPFTPTATLTGRTLRLWLPRAVRADEGPNGRAWKRKAAAAREWRQLVALALEVLGDRRPRWERARIHYDLFTRGAEIDPDNRVALGKPILDGLVAAGVLPDDSGAHVELTPAAWARSPLPWGFVVVRATRGSVPRS